MSERAEILAGFIRQMEARTEAALNRGDQLVHDNAYRRYLPEDGELQEILSRLTDLHGESNYPLTTEYGEWGGDNWLIGTGTSHDGSREVFITTDRVHASQMVGTADSDAEALVYLRNAVPTLIACLCELSARRGFVPDTPTDEAQS